MTGDGDACDNGACHTNHVWPQRVAVLSTEYLSSIGKNKY